MYKKNFEDVIRIQKNYIFAVQIKLKKALSILNKKGDPLSKKHLPSEFINPLMKGAYHELECLE